MRHLFALLLVLVVAPAVHPAGPTNLHIQLPGLTIRGGDQPVVEATGQICLTNGILEFLAVEPQGREYESLLTLDCRPSALQFALLLIGCETGAVPREATAPTPTGSRLDLTVEWTTAGQTRREPVEQWLLDRRTGQSPTRLDWVFNGSYFTTNFEGRPVFRADEEQAFIALWYQPAIPINLAGDYGNPYRGDNQGLAVNPQTVPPLGTKVKLLFRPRRD